MPQGNSGSFLLSGSQNFDVLIYWSETYNEAANTHNVSTPTPGSALPAGRSSSSAAAT